MKEKVYMLRRSYTILGFDERKGMGVKATHNMCNASLNLSTTL